MQSHEKRAGSSGSEPNEVIRATSQFMGYGMTLALAALLFFLVGHWADGKLGTDPILALLGLVIGASAGFYSLYRHVTEASRGEGGAEDEDAR